MARKLASLLKTGLLPRLASTCREEVDSHASMEVERAFAQLERMEQAVQQLTDAQTHEQVCMELAAVQAQCKSSNVQLAQEVAYVQVSVPA